MQKERKIKVGLTGGIGSGKSYVAKIIEKMGYPVFNSDLESKKILGNNSHLQNQISLLVGKKILDEEGKLEKQFLSEILFKNPTLRQQINELIHPMVRQKFESWLNKQDSLLIFNEAAILYETGAYKRFDSMILVCAPDSLKIERIKKRDSMQIEQVKLRMKAQWDDSKKIEFNPFIIQNDEKLPLLYQVEKTIDHLLNK